MALPTIDEQFNDSYQDRGIQPTYKTQRTESPKPSQIPTQVRNVEREYQRRSHTPARSPSVRGKTAPKLVPQKVALETAIRAKATTVSLANLSWSLTLWATIQLPIAIINAVFLGIMMAVDELKAQVTQNKLGEMVWNFGEKVVNPIADAAKFVLNVDIEALDPAIVFFVTNLVVFLCGIATLLILGIIYQLAFVNTLFGKGSHVKVAAFIAALVGYMLPILNIFPWFLFWVLAIWRYPK
jgi:hypothetical protein